MRTIHQLLQEFGKASMGSVGKSTFAVDMFHKSLSDDERKLLLENLPREMSGADIERKIRQHYESMAKPKKDDSR